MINPYAFAGCRIYSSNSAGWLLVNQVNDGVVELQWHGAADAGEVIRLSLRAFTEMIVAGELSVLEFNEKNNPQREDKVWVVGINELILLKDFIGYGTCFFEGVEWLFLASEKITRYIKMSHCLVLNKHPALELYSYDILEARNPAGGVMHYLVNRCPVSGLWNKMDASTGLKLPLFETDTKTKIGDLSSLPDLLELLFKTNFISKLKSL